MQLQVDTSKRERLHNRTSLSESQTKSMINLFLLHQYLFYRNDPKFSDRYVKANSADPDQTAPRGAV